MKPPICSICDERFFGGGGIIYFKEDAKDIEFNKRFKQDGFVGHPSNAFWFCKKHYSSAENLKHLTKVDAFQILRKK